MQAGQQHWKRNWPVGTSAGCLTPTLIAWRTDTPWTKESRFPPKFWRHQAQSLNIFELQNRTLLAPRLVSSSQGFEVLDTKRAFKRLVHHSKDEYSLHNNFFVVIICKSFRDDRDVWLWMSLLETSSTQEYLRGNARTIFVSKTALILTLSPKLLTF